MSQQEDSSTPVKYIAIDDLIGSLGLLDEDVLSWIEKDNPNISLDHRGRKSIPVLFLERYSSAEEYTKAFNKAVAVEKLLMNSDNPETNRKLKEKKLKLLDDFDDYINVLETIHCKYHSLANESGNESSIMAAFLLFSRVISTLKMCCLCQRNDYWYWGSLSREIDECLALAEYFVICSDTSNGKTDLHKWFRQHYSPKHKHCRKAISKMMSSIDNRYTEKENYDLINETYQKKSKLTHPTYLFIREITKYRITSDGTPLVEKIEYGACDYQRKLLELTEFFKSNILSSFLTFYKCFCGLPLTDEDRKRLRNIIHKINSEETEDFINRNQG